MPVAKVHRIAASSPDDVSGIAAAIEAGRIDIVVVYKIDRLSRSLMDFSKLVEVFDRNSVTFVSVTQSFNTTTSMGRLTLNILLSFAQFEREVTAERIRDKVKASRMKGILKGVVYGLMISTPGTGQVGRPAAMAGRRLSPLMGKSMPVPALNTPSLRRFLRESPDWVSSR